MKLNGVFFKNAMTFIFGSKVIAIKVISEFSGLFIILFNSVILLIQGMQVVNHIFIIMGLPTKFLDSISDPEISLAENAGNAFPIKAAYLCALSITPLLFAFKE